MMKIGQPTDISPTAAVQSSQAATAKAAQAAPPSAKNNDRKTPGVGVTVSNLARTLEQTGDGPEVDLEKVKAMREAIEQNTFIVNPEAIADKLLANAREMLKRTAN